ncbi:hypothetical protein CORC01_11372 [Colletotrichum orchidophilum]|uniref:Uncharacterized protein n=1 Tax=Colletotrichum orchidophilum TaxID=1209926 RepID=A0A1G4AVZ5_9PEZI|nr:hypothetical protein CORC01_11372 [Colletotrichum orchidophilum]
MMLTPRTWHSTAYAPHARRMTR